MSVLQALRRALVSVRDRWDRYRHPSRRARARAQLEALQPRVLTFVCLGNVCRSPLAARVAGARAPEWLEVDSAGFIGPGRNPPEEAVAVARRMGLDHTDHRSKTLTPAMAEQADAIVIFDRFNVSRLRSRYPASRHHMFWLGDFDPVWSGKRAIIDPWGKDEAEFERTFARIERCVADLLEALAEPEGGRHQEPSETSEPSSGLE